MHSACAPAQMVETPWDMISRIDNTAEFRTSSLVEDALELSASSTLPLCSVGGVSVIIVTLNTYE